MGRISSRLETIIPLVKAQVVASGLVDASRVFASLLDDKELMDRAPADQFIVIKPLDFPIWEEAVTGGGNDVLWVEGEWDITYFLRYAVDQNFADDNYLLDTSSGVLAKFSTLIHSLQLFDPTDGGGNLVLAEPMRLRMPGFRNMPTRHANMATWGRLKSYWEAKYIHLV